jgi:hypothetical protein
MGASIVAFIQIDDNTMPGQPPFTNTPSTWDLSHDIGLSGSKDYRLFAAIAGVRNPTNITLLYPLRGVPRYGVDVTPVDVLADGTNVGWLTLSEIWQSVDHLGIQIDLLSTHAMRVLSTMESLENIVGPDRVRLVFSIDD